MKSDIQRSEIRKQSRQFRFSILAVISDFGFRISSLVSVVFFFASTTQAQDVVRAQLERDSAWMGEAVPLIITLYSPGPFSGTASFDLPSLDKTAFVKAGNPIVGNEDVDGESYFTQRHEFTIFTQLDGAVVIPPFQIRFAGKQTFTSDPEPMEGSTPELRFQSKRPPGTERASLVVSAEKIVVKQTWDPLQKTEFAAGDVLQRTIQQDATGTTAMMLPAIPASETEGIRIYRVDPRVEDKSQRGTSTATRVDVIKYQFERPGTFSVPAVSIKWWDPAAEELKQEILDGLTITVTGQSSPTQANEPASGNTARYWWLIPVVIILVTCWVLRRHISGAVGNWLASHHDPESSLARNVIEASQSNDELAIYQAVGRWQRHVAPQLSLLVESDEYAAYEASQTLLSQKLFSDHPDEAWSATELVKTFQDLRERIRRQSKKTDHPCELPALNP